MNIINRSKYTLIFLAISSFFVSCNLFSSPNKINPDNDPVLYRASFSIYQPNTYNEFGCLFYYVKIFGLLKYIPMDDIRQPNIDSMFFSYYDLVKSATSKEEYCSVLKKFIAESIGQTNMDTLNNQADSIHPWGMDTIYFTPEISTYISKLSSINEGEIGSKHIKQTHLGTIQLSNLNRPLLPDFPDEKGRIWGLADYWNIINYFYAHKNLMNNNWDSVLYHFIQPFKEAATEKEYIKEIMKLTTLLNDCHSMVNMGKVTAAGIIGKYYPNFSAKIINDTFIVDEIYFPEWDDKLIQKGDIILKMNDIEMISLYDSIAPFYSASNNWSQKRIISSRIFLSFQEKNTLIISRKNRVDTLIIPFKEYALFEKMSSEKNNTAKKEVTVKKYDGISYIRITDLYETNFNKNMEILEASDQIILDFRGYPNFGISLKLLNKLLPPVHFFNTVYPYIKMPGTFKVSKGYIAGKDNVIKDKNVVILVDETTQSQSEFLVMAFQQCPQVQVIGTNTAGADGNVTRFTFPGNISVAYTGIGIRYPDNTETQQCGIKIDLKVEPTIKNIQEDKDAILEKAVHILSEK